MKSPHDRCKAESTIMIDMPVHYGPSQAESLYRCAEHAMRAFELYIELYGAAEMTTYRPIQITRWARQSVTPEELKEQEKEHGANG